MELKGRAGQLLTTLKGVQAEVAKTEKAADKATTGISHNMNTWASVGKYATIGIAGAAIAVGGYSLKMAGDFQAHMTLLQTAAGETSSNMRVVTNGVKNLAVQTGTSLDQLSGGMYTVEKAGIRGADGLKVLKAAAEGAKAENVDLSTATNALTSVMMSYHLKAKDAVSVENELVAGSGMAKTTMQEYAGSLSAVIPVASAAGIQFDQIGGAIATLTQHGTSAQESTQELANTIRNLQAPSLVSQKAMQQLGLNVNDVSTKLGSRGLTGTIDLVTNAISSKMGPGGLVFVDAMKKSQSASQDMQTMLTKMPSSLAELSKKFMDGQIGMKEYQTAFKGMGGSSYAMGAQFLALSKSTQGFNQMLTSGSPQAQTFSKYLKDIMGGATGMNTALMLGGENMGYFKKATEDVGNAGRKSGSDISTWAKTQQNFNVMLAQTWQGIQVMAVNIGTKLIPIVTAAVKGMTNFASGLSKGQPAAVALAVIVGTVLGSAIAVYIAKLTIAAVKSVVSFVQMVAAGIRWATSMAAQFALATARGAVWLATSTAQFVAWGAKQAVVLAQGVAMWARYGAMVIAEQLPVVASWVRSTAVTIASLVAQNAAMIAQKAVMIGGAVAMGVVTAAQWAWNVAMDANPIGLIILAIAALVATIIFLVTHWKQVTQFLQDTWKNVGNFFQTVGNAIASWWNGFWSGISKFVTQVISNVLNWIKGNWGLLLSLLIGPLGLAIQWIVQNWSGIVGFFQSVGNTIMGWWNGFWGAIGSFAQSVFSAYVNWLQSVWGGIIGFFQTVGGAISSAWNNLWSGLGSVVQSALGGVVGFVRGAMNGVIDVINGVIGSINGALSAGKAIGINVSIPSVPHFESGGTMPYSGYALVGEAGPELVQLPAGSRVFPNGSTPTQAAMQQQTQQQGTTKQVVFNNTFNTNASAAQITAEQGWLLKLHG